MKTRHKEMLEQMMAFHRQHPQVWILFIRFTQEKIALGFKHYSARGIFHRIRWETDQAQAEDFKLNNNHSPFYARAFMNAYPQHRGFFRLREQVSKGSEATRLPPLTSHDFPETLQ